MNAQYYNKVTIILEANNDGLENYPSSSNYEFNFDATDLTIYGYVEQFRIVLRAAGFSDKLISDALGEF